MIRGSTVVGTFGYMAPEQFQGRAVPATDLYSLGATLLFLLTHRSPAELPVERLKIVFSDRIQISEEFADWLEKILEPNLEDRFVSASQALNILQPKPKPITESFSKKGIALVMGLTISAIAIFLILDRNKYAVLNHIGFTEYMLIAMEKQLIPFDDYLAKGGDINIKNKLGQTFLHEQVKKGKLNNIKNIKKALAKGANPNIKDNLGQTPFHLATNDRIAKLLIDRGANINAVDNQGKTALHLALQRQNISLTRYLVNNNIKLDIEDKRKHTPLYIAYFNAYQRKFPRSWSYSQTDLYKKEHKYMFFFLVSKGAVFSETELDKLKQTINYYSSGSYYSSDRLCDPEKIIFLMASGLDINPKNNSNNMTPLQQLTNGNCYGDKQLQSVELLIRAGANVNVTDEKGRTPLHNVVARNYYSAMSVAKLLIDAGANVNATDNQGKTPLNLAQREHIEKLLIDAGAN
ncbi:hypothetical protein H1P_3510007 [Hyella patelloides LEGE 07179]|uniref:Protein kinase domain-containing protein n=2 Tax=Hyella TaxID=945733 RepID=A0A563VVX8_9CYAN|nr:hypothetical protein H1P_3510007 [Hyella patelloides LEGE 07179]